MIPVTKPFLPSVEEYKNLLMEFGNGNG